MNRHERYVEDSEKRLVTCERQLAKCVLVLYEKDIGSAPQELRLAIVDVVNAKQILERARKKAIDYE